MTFLDINLSLVNIETALLAAIPAVLNLLIVIYLMIRWPNKPLITLFNLLLICFICWQLNDAFARISSDANTAYKSDLIFSIGWIFSASFVFHFTVEFINHNFIKKSRILLSLSYFISLFWVAIYPLTTNESDYKYHNICGWINSHQENIYQMLIVCWIAFLFIISIALLVTFLLSLPKGSKRYYKTLLITSSLAIISLQGIFTEIVFPAFGYGRFTITSTSMIFFSVATFYALIKYGLFSGWDSINKDTLLSSVSDIIIVIDNQQNISYVNDPGLKHIGYTLDYLEGKSISSILKIIDKEKGFISPNLLLSSLEGENIQNQKCFIKTYNDEKIPVLVSSDIIKNGGKTEGMLLVARNIADLENARLQIERSEKRFRTIIEKSNDGIVLTNIDGKILYVSPSVTNIMGYSSEEFNGKYFNEFVHPDFVAEAQEIFLNANTFDVNIKPSIIKVKNKNKLWIWAEGTCSNRLNEPSIEAMVLIFRDVTEKYQIQNENENSLAIFRSLILNMKDGVLVEDNNKKVFAVNQEFCNTFSLSATPDTIVGKETSAIDEKADSLLTEPEIFAQRINEITSKQEVVTAEIIQFKDGRIYERDFIPIYSENSSFHGHLWKYNNVTEKANYLHEIRKQSALLKELFDASPIGIVMLDKDDNVVNVNPAFESMFQYSLSSIQGLSLNGLIVPEHLMGEGQQISSNCMNREVISVETRRKRKDNKELDVSIIGYPVIIDSELCGIYGMYEDISDKKRNEKELITYNSELIKINQELDKFVYSASHDIRSPMMSILGITNLAIMESENPTINNYFLMIQDRINKLDTFIKDIIHYSRNSRTELNIQPVCLQTLINEIIESLRYQDKARKIRFEVAVDACHEFYSDKSRIHIILTNFISNAIKYHKEETQDIYIKVSAKVDKDCSHITVEDNGEGISEENLKKLFDIFSRFSTRSDGSGLGLFIVKEMVDKLKGKISVESELNKGSRFNITIPSYIN